MSIPECVSACARAHACTVTETHAHSAGGESYVFSRTLALERHPITNEVLYDAETGSEFKSPKLPVDILWFPQVRAKSSSCTTLQDIWILIFW